MAWEAFNQMGYSVTCFEEKDIPTLPITAETPVFAGVTIFRKVIDKLGINYPPFDCYPTVLTPYYKRNIRVSTVGEERAKFHKDGNRVFVKPVLPKQFIGNVWDSLLNLIPLTNIPDSVQAYVCKPMDIVSEFRVYVLEREILGVKHYYGDWSIIPDKVFVEEVVKNYRPSPVAYGVDIGVTKTGESFVIEANDGCNLGNYGLDSIHFGEMIVSRWFEIMAHSNVEKRISDELEQTRETETFCGKTGWVEQKKEFYYKPFEGCSRSYKDILVEDKMVKLKE